MCVIIPLPVLPRKMCYMITRNTQGRKLCTGVKWAPQYPIVRAAPAQKGYEEANAPSMFCPPTLNAQCVVFDAATSNLFICLPHNCRLLVCKVGSGRKMGRKTWELGSLMPMSALITRRIDRAPIALVGVHRILQLALRKSKPLFPPSLCCFEHNYENVPGHRIQNLELP